MQCFLNAQPTEQCRRVALGVPALHLGKLLLQLRGANAVGVGKVLLGVERILFAHHSPELRVAHEDGVEHRVIVEGKVILRQDRESLAWAHADRATRRVEVATDGAQEGGFTGTVGTDDAITVAGQKLEIDVLKEDPLSESDVQTTNYNHDFFV